MYPSGAWDRGIILRRTMGRLILRSMIISESGHWNRIVKLKAYFGEQAMVPLYVEVDDGLRLSRALERERKQTEPKYAEMCRRFLADCEDFTEEKIAEAGIVRRFSNNSTPEDCFSEIQNFVEQQKKIVR